MNRLDILKRSIWYLTWLSFRRTLKSIFYEEA